MAKIRHGRYMLTPEQAEAKLSEQADTLHELKETVYAWSRAQLNLHQPYISGRVDVSTAKVENMKSRWLDQVARNLFCTECSTPWPCKRLTDLRDLREAASRGDFTELKTKIANMKPRRESHIDTAI